MVYTNKMKFNKKYGQKLQTANGKDDISKLTGISMKILDQVYDRGMGGKTQKTADADLWKQHLGNKNKKIGSIIAIKKRK